MSASLLTLACIAAARRWLDVVEVRGRSMTPTYRPGDRLLVERWTLSRRSPRVGDVVLARDPRDARRELVKRVAAVSRETVSLRGDATHASSDSRVFGEISGAALHWRVAFRYRAARNS